VTKLLLIMRNTYGWNGEHIDTLRRLGIQIHLATGVPGADQDGRFASVVPIPPELDLESASTYLVDVARDRGIETVITFYEADLVLTATVNAKLGSAWANPEADITSRDKRLQREFLAEHGIPSAGFAPVPAVDAVEAGVRAMGGFAYPVIVKPTYMSASIGVSLVSDEAELRVALSRIVALCDHWESYFLAANDRPIALIEEFLPGKEISLDGVVLFGKFHLAGVTDKMQMGGPYFDEDYYTLPFRTPEEEPELSALTQAIADGLGVRHCMMNVEFRRDAQGRYKVVEFTTRLAGGQNYLCLREVYGLDPVRLYVKAVLAGTDPAREADVWAGELPRLEPRSSTCIKYAYRYGTVLRNNAGEVALSPYYRSYLPAAKPGATLRRPPEGWYEFAGSLAISGPYRELADIDRLERVADELDARLDIVVI